MIALELRPAYLLPRLWLKPLVSFNELCRLSSCGSASRSRLEFSRWYGVAGNVIRDQADVMEPLRRQGCPILSVIKPVLKRGVEPSGSYRCLYREAGGRRDPRREEGVPAARWMRAATEDGRGGRKAEVLSVRPTAQLPLVHSEVDVTLAAL